MTIFLERIYTEALRWAYALSMGGWPEVLTEVALVALVATFAFVAWRAAGRGRLARTAVRDAEERERMTTNPTGIAVRVAGRARG